MKTFQTSLAVCLVALTTSFASAAIPSAQQKAAGELLSTAQLKGGFIVHLGCGDGSLTAALKTNDRLQVHGLARSAEDVAKARETISAEKLYGSVSVEKLSGEKLPYIDNFVNLVVVSNASGISNEEILRVLAPQGVALTKTGEGWKKVVKPRPKEIDDWTHFLHDPSGNAVAHDTVVGPPQHLQWLGSPRWSRHHDRMASMSALVSAAGRLFYIMDEGSRVSIQMPPEWMLVGRDAFNGTILWKKSIPTWHNHLWPLKSGPTQLARRLVATRDVVYVTLGIEAPVTAIDSQTGEVLRTFKETGGTEELIVDQGAIFALVNKGESQLKNYKPINAVVGDQGDVGKNWRWDEKPRVVMSVDAKSGKVNWSRTTPVAPLTLTTGPKRVYIHDGTKVVAIDRASGDTAWSSKPSVRRRAVTFNFGPRLVVYKNVLLYAGGERTMKAFDEATGKVLWEAPHDRSGYQSPEDLLVMQGLVWSAPTTSGKDTGTFTGRDVFTGEVKVEFPPNLDPYWFHHRCYIAKATDRFIMPSRTGIEFVDPEKKDWDIHHWVRGGCLYGIMPCNGLTYAPPHNCACYPEAKLYGFNALASASPSREVPDEVPEEDRIEKGPAFGKADGPDAGDDEWPTFRHDKSRSGSTTMNVAPKLAGDWETELGGNLTSVTVAEGKLFVASTDTHTVHALDANDGKKLWSFFAGARVDSPPTIEKGRAYFGANDGWIYCVRASDGELVWRYRGAPVDRRLMAFEQLESVWPVHGSVLVQNGNVFAVAGRSNFLDGGLRFLKLDAQSGSKLAETIIDEVDPETGGNLQDRHEVLQMPVGLPDILSSNGDSIFMKSQRLDQEGKRFEIGPNSADFAGQASVHEGENAHLFAPMGFLDDTWFHRSYWVYGRSFAGGHAGYYQAGRFAPAGRILVSDKNNVYGFGRKPEHLRWTTVLEHQLFSAPKVAPEVPEAAKARRRGAPTGASVRIELSKKFDPSGKAVLVEAWVHPEKPKGVIVAHGGPANGYALYMKQGKPVFAARVDDELVEVSGKEPIVRKWSHLVGVLTADKKVELYINGFKVASKDAPGLIPTAPAQSIEIGADEGSAVAEYVSPNTFTGVIDEVKILHGEFTSDDLEKVFANPKETQPLKGRAVLMCSFDDGKAQDASGLAHHGQIVGAQPVTGKSKMGLHFEAGKGGGSGQPQSPSFVEPNWTKDVPLLVRAMIKTGDVLFICGPADIIDEKETFERLTKGDESVQKILAEQDALLDGADGSVLRAISAKTGETLFEVKVDALPVWDGMAAAKGRVYLSTKDGKVRCLRASK